MVKKKISGQTIAIIILIILLIGSIIFGGVYAFYSTSTNKVSGTIVMANLHIRYKVDEDGDGSDGVIMGESGQSQILMTNVNNIVPNELLGNSPLRVINESNTPIYLAVLYKVQKATTDDSDTHLDDIYKYKRDSNGQYVLDEHGNKQVELDAHGNKQVFGVIDIGTEDPNSIWTDFIFDTADYPEYATDEITANDNGYIVRCFVTTAPISENQTEITVIEKNNLRLHRDVGNEFQQQAISFTFQAHAIGAESFTFDQNATDKEKCAAIVKAIYKTNGWAFRI